jgi:hypothetical protein
MWLRGRCAEEKVIPNRGQHMEPVQALEERGEQGDDVKTPPGGTHFGVEEKASRCLGCRGPDQRVFRGRGNRGIAPISIRA